jgi:hypothetical protein
MRHHRNFDDNHVSYEIDHDFKFDENPEMLKHKKQIRRMLEDRLEHKRLCEELEDEFDEEFDWGEKDK